MTLRLAVASPCLSAFRLRLGLTNDCLQTICQSVLSHSDINYRSRSCTDFSVYLSPAYNPRFLSRVIPCSDPVTPSPAGAPSSRPDEPKSSTFRPRPGSERPPRRTSPLQTLLKRRPPRRPPRYLSTAWKSRRPFRTLSLRHQRPLRPAVTAWIPMRSFSPTCLAMTL